MRLGWSGSLPTHADRRAIGWLAAVGKTIFGHIRGMFDSPFSLSPSTIMIRLTLAAIAACAASIAASSTIATRPELAEPAQRPSCGQPTDCQQRAQAAFRAEMARVGKDCTAQNNQHDDTECEGRAAAATEHNLAAFVDALQGIVGVDAVAASQRAWASYRKAQCDAVFDFFRGGTIAPAEQQRCSIALARSRMRDLDVLFEGPLHH